MSAPAANETTNGSANTAAADSIAHNAKGPENAAVGSDQAEAVLAVVAEGRRLYIGNLAYATTEGELNDFFKGYLVESVSIPVNPRSSRPVGYAFVDLSTATEAQRAIGELSGKEILSRKVSVQLARKPEDKKEAAATTTSPADGEAAKEGGRRRNSGRGRGRGRGRGGRRGVTGRDGKAEGDEVLPLTDTTQAASNEANIVEGAATSGDKGAPKEPRQPRQPRQRGPPEDGVPSKNKVMVANLPYDLSEEKLKELFAAYNPSAAKIALRPIPRFMVKKLQARGEPRKGRGFGFVSLESEDMQAKAVEEMNGKDIDGREIAVKVAIDSPGKEDVDPEAAGVAPLTENGVVQANDPPAAAATS